MEVHKKHAPKTPVTSIHVHTITRTWSKYNNIVVHNFISLNVVKQFVWMMQIK